MPHETENGTKSRFFLNDRYLGVFGKQASTNFRQVASIVSEWMPRSLVTPRQNPVSSAYMAPDRHAGLPAVLRRTVNLAAVIPDEINRSG
jgi:hypothetical protein